MCGGGSSGTRRSAGEAAGAASDSPAGGTCATCPQTEEARLVAVEWMHADQVEWFGGDPTTVTSSARSQLVNFPRDGFWESVDVVNRIDRLGHEPPIRIRFNRRGHHRFRVEVTHVPGGDDYTLAEQTRSSHFTRTRVLEGRTRADGTRVLRNDVHVAAAGGDQYRLSAEDDHGTVRQSQTLTVRRRVYYYVMKMRGVPAAGSLAAMAQEFARHEIQMVSRGEEEIDSQANVNTAAQVRRFRNNIRPLFEASQGAVMVPHVLLIAFINYDADRKRITLRRSLPAGAVPAQVTIPVGENVGGAFRRKPLWRNIDPAEPWLVSARYLRTGHAAMNIRSRCTPVGGNPCYQVRVRTSGLPAGPGRIELVVNVADGFYNGGAFTGTNLITLSTRTRWTDRPEAAQVQTVIHEIGHQFGFAPDGSRVDAVPFHYTGHGHRGNHCAEGLSAAQRAQADYGGLPGTCVMFGENAATRQNRFCANCARGMRKQDLCRGWRQF